MATNDSPYLDDSGRPQLRKSIAGFIDMLGFSQMAVTHPSLAEGQQMLDQIMEGVDDSRRFVRETIQNDGVEDRRWAIKFFSDNLVVGFPFDDTEDDAAESAGFAVRCAQRYQLRMALNGFFIRGAFTSGLICLTDDIIFGPTIVESYQLESKTAIVPRIIVTDFVQNAIRSAARRPDRSPMSDAADLICRDVDGWWFVNYLAAARVADGLDWEFIARHKQSILTSLSGTKRHDVLPKYGWACRYHNVFCHWHRDCPGYSDQYRIDRSDERSTITRITDAND